MPATLHAIAVDTWGPTGSEAAFTGLFAAVVVDVFEVEGVDVAGDVSAMECWLRISGRRCRLRGARGEK